VQRTGSPVPKEKGGGARKIAGSTKDERRVVWGIPQQWWESGPFGRREYSTGGEVRNTGKQHQRCCQKFTKLGKENCPLRGGGGGVAESRAIAIAAKKGKRNFN